MNFLLSVRLRRRGYGNSVIVQYQQGVRLVGVGGVGLDLIIVRGDQLIQFARSAVYDVISVALFVFERLVSPGAVGRITPGIGGIDDDVGRYGIGQIVYGAASAGSGVAVNEERKFGVVVNVRRIFRPLRLVIFLDGVVYAGADVNTEFVVRCVSSVERSACDIGGRCGEHFHFGETFAAVKCVAFHVLQIVIEADTEHRGAILERFALYRDKRVGHYDGHEIGTCDVDFTAEQSPLSLRNAAIYLLPCG